MEARKWSIYVLEKKFIGIWTFIPNFKQSNLWLVAFNKLKRNTWAENNKTFQIDNDNILKTCCTFDNLIGHTFDSSINPLNLSENRRHNFSADAINRKTSQT